MPFERVGPRAIDIIVPFFKRPDLVSGLFASIHRLQRELKESGCAIVAVNDSPDDRVLKEELAREVGRLDGILECTILENEANEGFVRSANRGLRETIRRGHDAILLNSDTLLFPGAVSEMQRVAYLDPAIGFVSPRSNNATLCSLPHQHEYNSLPPEESVAIYSVLASHLPDHHYVPTAVAFCLYIKLPVLEQIGIFDDAYSPGYNEENDLIMRARGRYRVALANRAYVYHVGSASFATLRTQLDERNAVTLNKRYPHYVKYVHDYYQSDHLQAELLLAGLLADSAGRWDLLLDLSGLAARDDHASLAIEDLVTRAVEQWRPWFNIFITGRGESLEFHELDKLSGVSVLGFETSRIFAIAVSFGLPCEYEQVARLSRMAVCNVYAILDSVIAGTPSCSAPVRELRDFVFQHADGLIYENEFARDQFRAQHKCHTALRDCVANPSVVRPKSKAFAHAAPAGRQTTPNPRLDESPSALTFRYSHEPHSGRQGQDSNGVNADDAPGRATEVLGYFLKETVECVSFEIMLKRRLRSLRLLQARMTSREIESSRDRLKRENEELEKLKREYLEKLVISGRERERALAELQHLTQEADQAQQLSERTESDLRAQISELRAEFRKEQLEIAKMRGTWSWRWTAPFRRLSSLRRK